MQAATHVVWAVSKSLLGSSCQGYLRVLSQCQCSTMQYQLLRISDFNSWHLVLDQKCCRTVWQECDTRPNFCHKDWLRCRWGRQALAGWSKATSPWISVTMTGCRPAKGSPGQDSIRHPTRLRQWQRDLWLIAYQYVQISPGKSQAQERTLDEQP